MYLHPGPNHSTRLTLVPLIKEYTTTLQCGDRRHIFHTLAKMDYVFSLCPSITTNTPWICCVASNEFTILLPLGVNYSWVKGPLSTLETDPFYLLVFVEIINE